MGDDLLSMKRYALAHGLCGRYAGLWDNASSPKDLVDMASDANGMSFMAEGFADGWCPPEEYVVRNFGDFINGAYVSRHKGYTGEIWCGERSGRYVDASAASVLVAHCDMTLVVPARKVCAVYVSGVSDVLVDCDGTAFVKVYGDNVKLRTSGTGTVKVTYVTERKFA